MAENYMLTVHNGSTLCGNIVVYLRAIGQDSNTYSLAWLSKSCSPNNAVKLEWSDDYCFAWAETGMLAPGVSFDAAEIKCCNPSDPSQNAVRFTMLDGAYRFTTPVHPACSGSLIVETDGMIPSNTVSIAVGMSSSPAFAINAEPFTTFSFPTHWEYWVAFGSFEQGEVIDHNAIPTPMKIDFLANVYAQDFTFNPDNTWSSLVH